MDWIKFLEGAQLAEARHRVDKDATWTVGLSSEGTIELVISSASGGHRCTLGLGYKNAVMLRDRLAGVIGMCKPPAENT